MWALRYAFNSTHITLVWKIVSFRERETFSKTFNLLHVTDLCKVECVRLDNMSLSMLSWVFCCYGWVFVVVDSTQCTCSSLFYLQWSTQVAAGVVTLTLQYSTPSKHETDPVLDQCWPSVCDCDAAPALVQNWINVSFLTGFPARLIVSRVHSNLRWLVNQIVLRPTIKSGVIWSGWP